MLLDTWAWLELMMEGPHAAAVERILGETSAVYTCPVVLAEVYSARARRGDAEVARRSVARIVDEATVIPHGEDHGFDAGRIHAEMRQRVKDFGLGDAFVLAAARSRRQKVLTGDPHFEGLPDAIMVG
jgi:predicted nucleic acid-binding protein